MPVVRLGTGMLIWRIGSRFVGRHFVNVHTSVAAELLLVRRAACWRLRKTVRMQWMESARNTTARTGVTNDPARIYASSGSIGSRGDSERRTKKRCVTSECRCTCLVLSRLLVAPIVGRCKAQLVLPVRGRDTYALAALHSSCLPSSHKTLCCSSQLDSSPDSSHSLAFDHAPANQNLGASPGAIRVVG